MRLRLEAWSERLRASLFVIPMFAVIAAVALGAVSLTLDQRLGQRTSAIPLSLATTVDGARSLLSTIAGATISFAGIAFSVSLLIIQQASSQYSPRVVHTLFRDPFNKRVMGLVVGTFTFCVVVLRSVRGSLETDGTPVIPNLSVAVAVVLGIATILAIVAFINHSAHSMDVSEILENVRREASEHVREEWRDPEPPTAATADAKPPSEQWATVRFSQTGWVQQLDVDALLDAVPDGSTVELEAHPGRYAISGTVLARVHPAPEDPDVLSGACNAAISTGDTRTMQQDASYGLRQLADVALKALSPGINDPTTAQDAIFHTAAVLTEMLHRDPPVPATIERGDRRILIAQQPTHADLVRLAFEETRRAAAPHPTVSIYLLEALDLLVEPLQGTELASRAEALVDQARLVVAGSRQEPGLLPADLAQVEDAFEKRFGPLPPAEA